MYLWYDVKWLFYYDDECGWKFYMNKMVKWNLLVYCKVDDKGYLWKMCIIRIIYYVLV